MQTAIVLGNELVKEFIGLRVEKGKDYRQAFVIDHSIKYDFGNFCVGIYKCKLTMLMIDEAVSDDEIVSSITWYGEFYFQGRSGGHIKENDLFGCIRYLSDKMEEHIRKKHGITLRVLPEHAPLRNELYALIVSTQS